MNKILNKNSKTPSSNEISVWSKNTFSWALTTYLFWKIHQSANSIAMENNYSKITKKISFTSSYFFFTIILCAFSFSSFAQIYSEDFSDDDGKGYENNTYTAPSDANWSLALVGSPDVNWNNYHCKVTSGYLQWRDIAGNSSNRVDWYSSTVSAGYTGVSISISYYGLGGGVKCGLEAFYQIDGGSWVSIGSFTN